MRAARDGVARDGALTPLLQQTGIASASIAGEDFLGVAHLLRMPPVSWGDTPVALDIGFNISRTFF